MQIHDVRNPVEHLLTLADLAQRHADPETAAWLAAGLDLYLTGADRLTLDAALGLGSTGRGKKTARTQYGKQQRDMALREAYALVDTDAPPTRRCESLAALAKDFEARYWPRWKDLGEPPAETSQLRRCLFRAKRTGEPLPTDWRTVWRSVFDY